MTKKNIAILFGGASAEYSISLQSAYAIITHLDTEAYEPVLVGITQEGRWLRYRGPAERILDDTWCDPHCCTDAFISPSRWNGGLVETAEEPVSEGDSDAPPGAAWSAAERVSEAHPGGAAEAAKRVVVTRLDAAFPVMHGTFGEDGSVQGLLAMAGIPLVGCDLPASAICMDKEFAHRIVGSEGLDVPRSATFDGFAEYREVESAIEKIGYPVFVKPRRAGSSFGISKVADEDGLPSALRDAFRYDSQIVIEEAIEGFEVGCAVFENGELVIGEPDEIELAHGFFDFREKYSLVTSKIHVPARIPEKKADEVREVAARIFRLLGCGMFARVDMFLTPDGRIVFNEVNTIPGFTTHSRYPTMLKAIGLEFGTVVNGLIKEALA